MVCTGTATTYGSDRFNEPHVATWRILCRRRRPAKNSEYCLENPHSSFFTKLDGGRHLAQLNAALQDQSFDGGQIAA